MTDKYQNPRELHPSLLPFSPGMREKMGLGECN